MAQFLGALRTSHLNLSLKPHSRGLTLLYFGYKVVAKIAPSPNLTFLK